MRCRLRVLQTHRAEKIAMDRARSGAPISPQCNRAPKPPNRAHRRRGTLAKSQCKPNFRRLVPTMMASTCTDRRRYACAARANHGKFGLDNLALVVGGSMGAQQTYEACADPNGGCGSDDRRHNHGGMLRKSRTFESDAASLHAIFGSPDDMKIRSCATLFAVAAGEADNPFRRTLDRWCDGRPDDRTLALIRGDSN